MSSAKINSAVGTNSSHFCPTVRFPLRVREVVGTPKKTSSRNKLRFELSVLDIFKRLPLHLYDKRRFNFFNIFEKQIYYSVVYFFILTPKNRNFFKSNILTYYSKNLGILNKVNFVKKSSFIS